jgi:hypothetical protein
VSRCVQEDICLSYVKCCQNGIEVSVKVGGIQRSE